MVIAVSLNVGGGVPVYVHTKHDARIVHDMVSYPETVAMLNKQNW